MRTRRAVPVVVAAAGLAILTAAPVEAATTATTTVTFTLTGGALAITAPPSVNLGSVATGTASLSGSLGPVTVTDARGLLVGSWTASVYSTNFVTGGGTGPETIPASSVSYASLTATATSGVGTFTPCQATVGAAAPLGTTAPGLTAYSATLAVGNTSATWNPTLIVNIPAAAVAGTYTGTLTHSVA